jgi:hypothetical protein
MDVGAQCLERRDVDDPRLIGKRGFDPFTEQPIQLLQERCQGLAGPRRSRDQGMPTLADGLPAELLGWGRLAEPLFEPPSDDRVKSGQGHWSKIAS